MYFKKSGTSETIGCNLTSNWEAKMEMPARKKAVATAFRRHTKTRIQSAIFLLALEAGLATALAAQAPTAASAPVQVGKVMQISGAVTVTRAGKTSEVPLKAGDPLNMGDTIFTDDKSSAFLLFADNTQLKLAEDSEVTIDDYVYDQHSGAQSKERFSIVKGAFEYISGLIAKTKDPDVKVDTPVGALGDRGTEYICEYEATAKTLYVYLSSGAVDFTATGGAAAATNSGPAPAEIKVGASGAWVLTFTQDQYNAIEAQLFPVVPAA